MRRQLDTAHQQLLSHGTCSAGQLGWCGDQSPWIWLGTGDGFRWSSEYFNERGERVGAESEGAADDPSRCALSLQSVFQPIDAGVPQ
jgi:hypothetical protein